MLMVFNPTNEPIIREISLPLYYTGLTDFAYIREKEEPAKKYKLERDYTLQLKISIPANSYNWYVIE